LDRRLAFTQPLGHGERRGLVLVSVVTLAICVRPPDVIVTSPNVISAACSVMLVPGSVRVTRIVSRPRKVSFARSAQTASV
jgi:hypothetical protein